MKSFSLLLLQLLYSAVGISQTVIKGVVQHAETGAPVPSASIFLANTSVGTNYFSSAAFWKLRELAIAYELPFAWIGEKQIIKRIVVSFVGRNLFMFIPDSNQWTDPEFNYSTTNNTFGINSTFSTPPARTFGASLNLTF